MAIQPGMTVRSGDVNLGTVVEVVQTPDSADQGYLLVESDSEEDAQQFIVPFGMIQEDGANRITLAAEVDPSTLTAPTDSLWQSTPAMDEIRARLAAAAEGHAVDTGDEAIDQNTIVV